MYFNANKVFSRIQTNLNKLRHSGQNEKSRAAVDVATIEQVEKALRESEDRYRQLLESLPIAVYTCDRNGTIDYFNDQAVKLWGLRPHIGDSEAKFSGSFRQGDLDGTMIPDCQIPMMQVLTEGRALRNLQVVIERPDASPITVLGNIEPILDQDGRILGAVKVFQDVTALNEAKLALQEQKRLLQSITDNADTALFIMDDRQHCVYMNPAAERLSGYSLEETKGRPLHDVVHHIRPDGSPYPLSECPIDQAFPKNDREQGEEVFIHKDGHFYPVAFTASPLRNEQKQLVGTIIEVLDITERKQAEEALREDDRRKNQFLATLAHELRNPLAPISNGLHLLQMPGIDKATAEQIRDMMARQVNHLVRLVDDLMDVSRITRGLVELHRERVDLTEVLLNAVESSRPLIDQEKHQFDITIPAEPLMLEADKVRLAQIITNLLNNAAKYTPKGGKIWLSARREGSHAVVSVRDNGLGISAEMQSKVFEMFTQVDHRTHHAQGGLGIGLTLVQNLVNLHGGSIEVKSEGVNQGSEFLVWLPLAENILQPNNADPAENPPINLIPQRILVVDDNKDAADSLALLLKLLEADVLTVNDGPTALETVKSFRPSVVLLDIGMPGMDGYEVARRMRQLPEGDAITLIALTGWGQDQDRRKSADAGINHHLVKPVDLDTLIEVLSRLTEHDATR
jgi:PAS domain S-box-containing protein